MPKLMRVGAGWTLLLPAFLNPGPDRLWLRAGGIVDVDDPFTAHSIKGQEHKLEPVDAAKNPDAKVSPTHNARLNSARAEFEKRRTQAAKPKPGRAAVAASKMATAAAAAGDIPIPDEVPDRRGGRK